MENNKLLIGVQFTELGPDSKYKHYNLELYVLRDLQLIQLLEGVKYGLRRLAEQSSAYQEIYQRCRSIYAACIAKTQTEPGGRQYLTHVTFTSYHSTRAEHWVKGKERPLFYVDELTKPICDLGFITSTRIIFDLTGSFVPQGMLDTTNVIEAFNPRFQNRISFPEYNISSRQLSRLDDTPVEILSPTEHPKKPKSNLLATLLPSLLTMGVLMLVRGVLMSNSSSSGLAMIALSGAMGITALITTALNFRRQKKEFAADLKAWR